MIEVDGVEFITAQEAPEHLGDDITPEMVRNWGSRRLVQGYRVGRHTYYALDDLIEVEFVVSESGQGRPRRAA